MGRQDRLDQSHRWSDAAQAGRHVPGPDGQRAPGRRLRPDPPSLYVPRDQRTAEDGSGLFGSNDCCRGPGTDVSRTDRGIGDRELVDRFCDMLAAEVGASRNTLLAYRRDLEAAFQAIGSLETAGSAEVSRLGSAWAALAPSTVARRSAALRRFFGFLLDEGFRIDDPSAALP